MREKQTDEGQEAPIQPQIALTTEKKPASFNVSAIGLQYVLVCSITILSYNEDVLRERSIA